MNPHLEAEILAGIALGDAPASDTSEYQHLADCAHCTAELQELQALVTAGHTLESTDVLTLPPPQVWESIRAEIGVREAEQPAATKPDDQELSSTAPQSAGRRGRNRWLMAVAAGIAGVLIGVLGTVAIRTQTPSETLVSQVALEPLEGKAGSGEARLVQTAQGLRLQVTLTGVEAGDDADLEVWLINSDGERMRSLGLAGTSGGTFNVPAWMVPSDFRIVDVSQEPHDGVLKHSGLSEVRGTLPT